MRRSYDEWIARGSISEDLAKMRGFVELVRCKNCKYWQDNNSGYPHPDCRWNHDETPDADDFCSFAEKQ